MSARHTATYICVTSYWQMLCMLICRCMPFFVSICVYVCRW